MPFHRNESASQKILSFTGETTFVKENYMLSRERITVFTQVFSDKSSPLTLPEFVFQGKGTRIKFNQPKGTKVIGHQRHHIRFTQCFTRSPIYQIDTTCSRKVIMASLF